MALENQQKLVLSIIEFLNQSIQDGLVPKDDKEGLEIAVQCISEAFGVDLSDKQQVERLSIKPATLQSIFDVFLKTRAKVPPAAAAPTSPTNPIPAPSPPAAPSADAKALAEKLKQAGNSCMTSKDYAQAIDSYTKAITIDSTNPVYYSNRAAAHSSRGDHLLAAADAEKALEVDSSFVKAYSRLGHARYSLGDFKAAAAAFQKGLELEPTNANLKSGLQNAQARVNPEDDTNVTDEDAAAGPSPGLGGMADMLRNMGGGIGGAGGGMPDPASLMGMMNNPLMMQMAQQMMQNGGLEALMSNPAVANMMNRVQSGGGLPSADEILSDPNLRNLAQQFGAGGTGAGGAAGGR